MKGFINIIVLAAIISCALLMGCRGQTMTGTDYTMSPARELEASLIGNLETVHNTAVRVLKEDLEFNVESEVRDAFEGDIKARSATRDRITVQTFKESDRVTRIQVWYGPLGDEDRASRILSAIEEALPKGE